MSRWLGLAAFAALGAFVVMTCWITARPLWLDEAFERRITTLPVDVWFDLLYTREANMVFHHAFLRAWTGAQESAVVWVRLPSALATAGACFVFVGLARRLLRDPRLAVVATFLFATNAFVLGHGIQARGYAFVLLFAVVSTRLVLASVDRAVERRPDAGTSLGYAVSAILLTTAHVLASSLLAVHAVAWLVRWRSRTRAGRRRILARTGTAWLVACLASALVAGFVFGQGREGQVDWIERPGFFGIYHALRGLAGNETYTTLFTLLLVSMCCLRCWRHPTLERSIIAGGLLLPILTSLALTFLLRPLWVERYLIPASPFLALALADGIGTILNRR
ncbi:MAG: hypothetical protein H6834_18700, partial [Planctomycetes bacterium]|nr:hypothetical protein [Planctomycetota bacterium]